MFLLAVLAPDLQGCVKTEKDEAPPVGEQDLANFRIRIFLFFKQNICLSKILVRGPEFIRCFFRVC